MRVNTARQVARLKTARRREKSGFNAGLLRNDLSFPCPKASDTLSRALFWYNKIIVGGRSVSGNTSTATQEHGRGSACASSCEADQNSAFLEFQGETLWPSWIKGEDLEALLRFNLGVFLGIPWQPLMSS
jgi:hypothetical protein